MAVDEPFKERKSTEMGHVCGMENDWFTRMHRGFGALRKHQAWSWKVGWNPGGILSSPRVSSWCGLLYVIGRYKTIGLAGRLFQQSELACYIFVADTGLRWLT
jgi:hypothetical protein